MAPPAPRGGRPWRARVRALHRWFGLLAALWLLLLSLTGSAIVFYDELDRWLNPGLRLVPAGAAMAPVEVVAGNAAGALPGFRPRFVDLPNRAGDTVMLLGSAPLPGGGEGAVQLFADPRDGAVLGWRLVEPLSLAPRDLMNGLYALHMDLMLGPAVAWFLGLVALGWVLDHGAAALLAFPPRARWQEAFRVQGRRWGLRWLFDLHRAWGVWLFPVTLVLAVTSVTLAWHEDTRALARLAFPVSERLHEGFADAPPGAARAIGVDEALRRAVGDDLSGVDSVVLLARTGAYGIRRFDPRDMDGYGRLWTYVSMADGRVMGERHDRGEGAADAFFAWQYPLHSGKGLGLPGRLLVLAGGLATAGLCVTGLWLWWRRRPALPRRGPRERCPGSP